MVAKKCDLCGSYYDDYNTKKCASKPNSFMFLNIDSTGRYLFLPPSDGLLPEVHDWLIGVYRQTEEGTNMNAAEFEIIRTGQCYYSLYIDGTFEGNYDTHSEAANAADEALAMRIKEGGSAE